MLEPEAIRRVDPSGMIDIVASLPEALLEPFGAVRMTLYRSELRPMGAEYLPLAAMDLPPIGRERGDEEDG